MKRSLANPADRRAVIDRLQTVRSESARRWSRMTAHQAICHLSDAFRLVMKPVRPPSRSNLFSKTFIRLVALHSGLPWPSGVKTVPEVDQAVGGTPPTDFIRD